MKVAIVLSCLLAITLAQNYPYRDGYHHYGYEQDEYQRLPAPIVEYKREGPLPIWNEHNPYPGPIHIPLIKKDGNLVDTPSVAEVKRRFRIATPYVQARAEGRIKENVDDLPGIYLAVGSDSRVRYP